MDVLNGFLNPTETLLYVSVFGGTDTVGASSTFEHAIPLILAFVAFFAANIGFVPPCLCIFLSVNCLLVLVLEICSLPNQTMCCDIRAV